MSGKLFLQIAALIIIFAIAMSAVKCLHKNMCLSCKGKAAKCAMMGDAIAK